MAHRLYLVHDPADPVPRGLIAAHAREAGTRVSVVLLPGGPEPGETLPGQVYRLVASADLPRATFPAIDHAGLLELIFEADSVVTW